MPICTQCGAQSPDTVSQCVRCGANFAQQSRLHKDAQRAKVDLGVKWVIRLAIVVVLLVVAPIAFHFGKGEYLKYQLHSATEYANQDCGGPLTSSTPDYQRTQISDCLAKNQMLLTTQQAYDDFFKPAK